MRLDLDLGTASDVEWLESHLAERGLGIADVYAAAPRAIIRRKGNRMYAYGRATSGLPIVVVLAERRGRWRPRTAWPMNTAERRWWKDQGGL